MEPGGKGANQAAAAARDGAHVALAGAVGRDGFADRAVAGLLAAGVDLRRLARVDAMTGLASIIVDRTGQNSIVVASGANRQALASQVADADLSPGTTLVLQMELDAGETAALIRRAKAAGSRVVLNLAPAAPLAADALRMVDWLVVNATEAAWLSGRLGCADDAASLHAALGVGVVRTDGAEGATAASDGRALAVAGRPVDVVDTTGAGDCFTGVFAAALDRGQALPDALHRATAAAALCCTRPGAQDAQPNRTETDAALNATGPG